MIWGGNHPHPRTPAGLPERRPSPEAGRGGCGALGDKSVGFSAQCLHGELEFGLGQGDLGGRWVLGS